ncbi:transmembrane protein 6/97 [Phakopsora pachyrhizi]|uniref:Efficient mitochondria targeting-associated protein 19 n=1 Tax=Phakopsora pachyrhizi TaxID=170000 RepID=A0AAV0AF74_PHAPC|nr:transmembrane protein 6/97 [Phakopsora pachyrhizi]CAH7665820.1 transmembrane protein 6/97 [Phakopsora pachyrhizi]
MSTERVDRLYIAFFLIHTIATLVIDIQSLLPAVLVFKPFKSLLDCYMRMTNDPLIIGAYTKDPNFLWFRFFLWHELIFLLPCFIFGTIGLMKDNHRIYPLLLGYGAAATTTTTTCVVIIAWGMNIYNLNMFQFFVLIASYVPFMLIPFCIMLDMYFRLQSLVKPHQNTLKSSKTFKKS